MRCLLGVASVSVSLATGFPRISSLSVFGAPSDPKVEESVNPAAVIEFEKSLRELNEAAATARASADDDEECPPRRIVLDSNEIIQVPETRNFAGSDSSIFVSSDQAHVVKTVDLEGEAANFALDGLNKDKAFMKIFDGTNVIPHMHAIAPGSISPSCDARTLVADFAGFHPLGDLAAIRDRRVRMRQVALAAARMLEIIQVVHSKGFVHGDIHPGNFVFSDPRNVAKTLRLIDFGRAEPYINNKWRHVAEGSLTDAPAGLELDYLSPWEILGKRKSRRDDLFRIAESLLRLGSCDTAFTAAINDQVRRIKALIAGSGENAVDQPEFRNSMIDLNLNRPFLTSIEDPVAGTPESFIQFYRYVVNLRYDEHPQYAVYAGTFRAFSGLIH